MRASDKILHHTFDAGEGVLIPAEILEHAKRGCRNFVILQPFGCLPNHVVGRGLIHALKEQYPTAQFLPLDYDPRRELRQRGEPSSDAHHERQGAGVR